MKIIRPQSAKHGSTGKSYTQESFLPLEIQEYQLETSTYGPQLTASDSNHRLRRLMKKPTNKIVPRNISNDRQHLYSEIIALKEQLHCVHSDKIKMQTKITILEKENAKLNAYILSEKSVNTDYSSFRLNQNQKESSIVVNLKRLLKQANQNISKLTQDLNKMKRTVKYTQINELDLEKKSLADQTTRLRAIIEQLVTTKKRETDNENKVRQLEQQLRKCNETIKYLAGIKQNYQQYVADLQLKYKQLQTNDEQKHNKMFSDLNEAKTRIGDLMRKQQIYLTQINNLRGRLKIETNKIYHKRSIKAENAQDKKNAQVKKNTEIDQLKNQNTKLQQKITEFMLLNGQLNSECQNLRLEMHGLKNSSNSQDKQITQDNFGSYNTDIVNYVYDQKHEKEEAEQCSNTIVIDKNTPSLVVLEQDYTNYGYQEFDINQESNRVTIQQTPFKKNKSKWNQMHSSLATIGQLVTYRMKAQRYVLDELKHDIEDSNKQYFSSTELHNLFAREPFYLDQNQIGTVLIFLYDNADVEKFTNLTSRTLLLKLEELIENFDLPTQQEEYEMSEQVQQMLVDYGKDLQKVLDTKQNASGTIAKLDLIKVLKQLQLQDHYIDLIVRQLSMVSKDLANLKYGELFKKAADEDSNEYNFEESESNEQLSMKGGSKQSREAISSSQALY